MGFVINAYEILVGKNLKGRDYFGDQGVDGKIILTWIFKE
jgi:hypothetical protein